jgi:hemin uptake protein HemP
MNASGSPKKFPAILRETFEGLRAVCSKQLFEGRKEIVIVHTGTRYRLRITSQGKLLLTK